MRRIVLTGASGVLGTTLSNYLREAWDVTGLRYRYSQSETYLDRLDVTDARAVTEYFLHNEFDACIHAAGNCDVDDCERRQDAAFATNVGGTLHVANMCRLRGIRLIYISSDHVFAGEPGMVYDEFSLPFPIQQYGRTKLAGEIFAASVAGHLILRIPILYGPNGLNDKPTFATKVLRDLLDKRLVFADDSQVRYPLLVDDLGPAIDYILRCDVTGVLHYAPRIGITKYAWAQLIADELGVDRELIRARREQQDAPRPRDNRMVSRRTDLSLNPPMEIVDGVRAVVRRWQGAN